MANHDKFQECPALEELVAALRSISELAKTTLITIRHDASRHTAGLAVDIMLHSKKPAEKAKADQLIWTLVEMHPKMLWYDLIYTDFHIPGHPLYAGKHLTKTPTNDAELAAQHENHIHLDWCDYNLRILPKEKTFVYDWPEAARTTNFAELFKGVYLAGY